MPEDKYLLKAIQQLVQLLGVLVFYLVASSVFLMGQSYGLFEHEQEVMAQQPSSKVKPAASPPAKEVWHAPDTSSIPVTPEGALIRYGRELIAHTAVYLGPKGTVQQISNGMNCQNCHLQAGTVPFGNNYGAVATTYPKFRHRSGTLEGFEKRINDCLERSLNGQALEVESREMKAMVAYMQWVGKDVVKGSTPEGFGLLDLKPLDRAADPVKGKLVYDKHCTLCHGSKGEGIMAENGLEWTYPPLYGPNSYNIGAGLYRLSRFAGFVKANMPYGTTYENPVLTDEEAWDVAAFVNAMARPAKDLSMDWPDISKKPFDHPFGPYADHFSEEQHKFGPFDPIKATQQ